MSYYCSFFNSSAFTISTFFVWVVICMERELETTLRLYASNPWLCCVQIHHLYHITPHDVHHPLSMCTNIQRCSSIHSPPNKFGYIISLHPQIVWIACISTEVLKCSFSIIIISYFPFSIVSAHNPFFSKMNNDPFIVRNASLKSLYSRIKNNWMFCSQKKNYFH